MTCEGVYYYKQEGIAKFTVYKKSPSQSKDSVVTELPSLTAARKYTERKNRQSFDILLATQAEEADLRKS